MDLETLFIAIAINIFEIFYMLKESNFQKKIDGKASCSNGPTYIKEGKIFLAMDIIFQNKILGSLIKLL